MVCSPSCSLRTLLPCSTLASFHSGLSRTSKALWRSCRNSLKRSRLSKWKWAHWKPQKIRKRLPFQSFSLKYCWTSSLCPNKKPFNEPMWFVLRWEYLVVTKVAETGGPASQSDDGCVPCLAAESCTILPGHGMVQPRRAGCAWVPKAKV